MTAMSATLEADWVTRQPLQSHDGQVAGHPGSLQAMRGPNGEALVVKESLSSEIDFYEQLRGHRAVPSTNASQESARKQLHADWTPTYWGSLGPLPPSTKPSVILQDLLAEYKRANVMDIKLGTQLWDENSSEEKKQRMEQASRDTTSFETGIRLTGWRTWDQDRSAYVPVTKSFGKSIKADDLHLGLKAFFHLLGPQDRKAFLNLAESTNAIQPSDLPGSIAPHTAPPQTASTLASEAGHLDRDSSPDLVRVLNKVALPALDRLLDLFQTLEVRIRGGSLLLVYEGDADARRNLPLDDVMTLKLIDFAHATFVPGQGPDEGVVLGLKTIKQLVIDITHARETH